MTLALIATGPPGSGKSSTLTALDDDVTVVAEAATDVNLELLAAGVDRPERAPDFLSRIVARQRERRLAAGGAVQVHDRSVFCTLALAEFLGLAVPAALTDEVAEVRGMFSTRVLFFAGWGAIVNTPVRRIGYADAVAFGAVHRRVYLDHGFELVEIPPAAPAERVRQVRAVLRELTPAA